MMKNVIKLSGIEELKWVLVIGIAGLLYMAPNANMNFNVTISVSVLGFLIVSDRFEGHIFKYSFLSGVSVAVLRILLIYGIDNASMMVFTSVLSYYTVYGLLSAFFMNFIKNYSKETKIVALSIIDVISNWIELMILHESASVSLKFLVVCAVVRGLIIWGIMVVYEENRMLIIKEEHEKRYERLNDFIVNIYAEVFYLKKSQKDLEDAMKAAHKIYNESKNQEALNLAIQIHEIKKDYYRLISGMSHMIDQVDETEQMSIKEIFKIIKKSMEHQMESLGKKISLYFIQHGDGFMVQYYDIFVILNNLIINAIDACQDGDMISVSFFQMEDHFLFVVKDTGCGIAEDVRDCIFSPGFSTKFDVHTGEMSSGIGLCHVKEIVEKRKGTIQVESTEKTGTEFLVWIPMKGEEK